MTTNDAADAFDFDSCSAWGAEELGACPYCGGFPRLDVLGGDVVDFAACCESAGEEIGAFGFSSFYGMSLEDAVELVTGVVCRGVGGSGTDDEDDDGADTFLRFTLEGFDPGKGLSGWRAEAFDFVEAHHSHHEAPAGWRFGVAVDNGEHGRRVGVAVVGNPQARMLMKAEPGTWEVTRVCCHGPARLRRNVASKLYSLAAKRARAEGCTKLITYTLLEEDGTSLRASGWRPVRVTAGGSWSRPSRPRRSRQAGPKGNSEGPKVRWELVLNKREAVALPALDAAELAALRAARLATLAAA